MEKPKKYDAAEEEARWKSFWHDNNHYQYTPNDNEDFVIDTPPPTVSGNMHIGHAFSYAQEDFIARFKRMIGFNVCYPFGTDDNGLPTERLIEKKKKVTSRKMERQAFIDLCNKTIKELKPDFISDWIDLGMSCDFKGSYSTIDPHAIATSQASFIDLFNKGYVHQEESPISWCTHCQTAIAQAEFENVDKKSHFNDIIFKAEGQELVVATTRPELLPSCVAVFFHPTDKRYTALEGKMATVPLMNHEVPILADEKADPEKGTGLVMCCTFGDKTDIEWWRQHNLPLRVSISKFGKMTELAGKYANLKVTDARAAILVDLKEEDLLLNQKEIIHPVNTHDKCGTAIEYLKTKQWFVKVIDHKEKLLTAADELTWYPKFMKSRYTHWVENLNWDWCISRQRHFGISFPVWFEKDTGKPILASLDQLPVNPLTDKPASYEGNPDNLVAEVDVMDTWATSSVTPQIICNWKSKGGYNLDMSNYPVALRPQAHDIIRTWAFYTIVKGLYHHDTLPWKEIMVSGFVLDPKGNKMSKSKGNVIDPRGIREKYGADAMRFWAASGKLGDDVPVQDKELVTGKKTVTKLWNASSFAFMHLEGFDGSRPASLTSIDQWLLAKLNNTITRATSSFEKYEYSTARHAIDRFFWNDLCDNYLEIVKDRLYKPEVYGEDAKKSAQFTLHTVFGAVLKLYAPIMPFITESCYQYMFKADDESIHLSSWPCAVEGISANAETEGDIVVSTIGAVRSAKSSDSLALNVELLSLTIIGPSNSVLEKFIDDIKATTKADVVTFCSGEKLSLEYELKK